MSHLPEPYLYWWRLFATARSGSQNVTQTYGDAAHEVIVQLSRCYFAGDLNGMISSRELLAASRRWCEHEPLRSKYELMVCRAAFYFTLWELDNFNFDECVQRFAMVDQLIVEKRERREKLGLPPTPESYMRLDILMAKADAKWKAPSAVGLQLPGIEAMCDELLEIHQRICAASEGPLDPDLKVAFANIAVSMLTGCYRYEPEALEQVLTRLESMLATTEETTTAGTGGQTSSHWQWRLAAGRAFVDRQLTEESLQELEEQVLATVEEVGLGRDLTQYRAGIQREFAWLKRARNLQLV
jgi:hypothetical protein